MSGSDCVTGIAYAVTIDWANDGNFTGLYDDVTTNVLDGGVSSAYGREQNRQLSPGSVGHGEFDLVNAARTFSPENVSSPLYGDLEPARPVEIGVTVGATAYPVFTGRLDDFEVHPDRSDRSVSLTALDGMALLQKNSITTELLIAQRTGQIVDRILDAVGWTAGRDLDVGATFPRYWWAQDVNAFDAIQDIVRSEGPPAVAYVAPDGTFVFRDRHHRLQAAASLTSQATYSAVAVDCDAPAVTGFDYTAPFVYENGWKNIINLASMQVEERQVDSDVSVVWSSEATFTITAGQTVQVNAVAQDPFQNAVAPVPVTDITTAGGVTVTATLSGTSGQSVVISVTGVSGTGAVTYLQLRALSVPVAQTVTITQTDAASITANGLSGYPEDIPWGGPGDVLAVEQVILAHYAQRSPIVQMRLAACDEDHLLQILTRTLSDRITIVNGELGMTADFYIESVAHTIRRMNTGRIPVHSAVLGCEKITSSAALTPFTFDLAGHGFDDGQFVGVGVDDPDTVFIFDDPANGQFDFGVFGT